MNDENLKKIAEAEAKVIAEYFSMKKKVNFAVTRTEIPSGSDLNEYLSEGEFYFSGNPGKVINSPPAENEDSAFILDVETCFVQGVPYVVQKTYYPLSAKQYVRGIYVNNGKFSEVHNDWSKK